MSDLTSKDKVTSDDVMDPDTFWDLIQKLLLHSSSDERARTRHNLSLSVLCKSQALPPLPRPIKTVVRKEYGKKIKKNEESRNPTAKPNSISRSSKLGATGKANSEMPNRTNKTETKPEVENINEEQVLIQKQTPNKINSYRKENEDVSKDKTEIFDKMKSCREVEKKLTGKVELASRTPTPESPELVQTRSECSLNDLRVQLIRDTNVPASERLWRFAMHNKKRTDDKDIRGIGPMPKTRSNEAIYKGLQERIKEAERDAALTEEPPAKIKEAKASPKLEKEHPKPPKRHTCRSEQREIIPALYSNTVSSPLKRRAQSKKTLDPINKDVKEAKSFAISKQQEFDERKTVYDNLIKKRLNCGSQLESLNVEVVGNGNPRSVLNSETKKRYNELKAEYLNLCYKESRLRHQIAMLHAEVYMMQNKGYHKTPAAVKTITLDPKTTPMEPNSGIYLKDQWPTPPDDAPFYPPLKPPRPLLQTRAGQEKIAERFDPKKQIICPEKEEREPLLQMPHENPSAASICSVYSITPGMTPPPQHVPTLTKTHRVKEENSLIKLLHRLPKLKSTTSLCSAHANRC